MSKLMAKESTRVESLSKSLVEKVKNALPKEIMNKPKTHKGMLFIKKIWQKNIVFYQTKLMLCLKDSKLFFKTKDLMKKCKV